MVIPGAGGEGEGMDEEDFITFVKDDALWDAFSDQLTTYRSYIQKYYLQERVTFGEIMDKKKHDLRTGKGRKQDWIYGTREVAKKGHS